MAKEKKQGEATVADLRQDERNYRKHSEENKKRIKKSIDECGLGRSVVVDADGVLVAGNGVQSVLPEDTPIRIVETDGTELVVVKRTDLHEGDERRKKLALADNATSDNVEWDFDAMAADGWDEEAVAEFGVEWTEDEEEGKQQEAKEDDFDIDKPVETVCKKGDIWQLGNHRLMCGDSTDAGSVALLMDGEKAQLLLTDPPYGISVVSKDGSVGGGDLCAVGVYSPVIGDETTETAEKSFKVGQQFADKQIIFGGNYFTSFLPQSDGWLIWDKRGESGIRNNFADGEMAWCSFHTPVRIYHQLWVGMIKQDEHEKRVHPTQKPVRMLSEIMTDFSTDKDSILDLFGGSGTTLIAAEQLNRKCYMMELDPHYCDVIIARWEKLTGKNAEKLK